MTVRSVEGAKAAYGAPRRKLTAEDREQQERWQTPPEIWNPLNAEFRFDLDAAADERTYRVRPYLTDALSDVPWPGTRIWLNPPYGRMLDPFVRRAANRSSSRKACCGAHSVSLSSLVVA